MTDKPNFVLIPDDAPPPARSAPVRTGGALSKLRSMATTIVRRLPSSPRRSSQCYATPSRPWSYPFLAACRTRVFQPIDFAEVVRSTFDGSEIRYDSALWAAVCLLSRLGFLGVRTPFALRQAGRRTNIRFIFQAMVTRLHSPRTRSIPRSRNWRNPSTDLMMPNTGSGICLRSA